MILGATKTKNVLNPAKHNQRDFSPLLHNKKRQNTIRGNKAMYALLVIERRTPHKPIKTATLPFRASKFDLKERSSK